MTQLPMVSLVVLCRNEAGFIEACLDSLLEGTYPHDRVEAIVVDGMSDDGTLDILSRYAATDSRVRIVANPRRITPVAFNLGIAAARGEIVMPIGAHCVYQPTYIQRLVDEMQRSGADNVGGVCQTVPANGTAVARAIAAAMAHPLGVGNSHFRVGATEPRWVDTVPFGCYRTEVFSRIGLFDEELLRNQDDEFNHRLISAGGRILLVPDVSTDYYARDSMRKLAAMFWQYGHYKPLVVRKLGHVPTLRQLVPPAFVAALVGSALLAILPGIWRLPLALLLICYGAVVLLVAIRAAPRVGVAPAALLIAAIPVIHLAYGSGWLRGAWDFLVLRRAAPASDQLRVTR